jgi:hypothetical protein
MQCEIIFKINAPAVSKEYKIHPVNIKKTYKAVFENYLL